MNDHDAFPLHFPPLPGSAERRAPAVAFARRPPGGRQPLSRRTSHSSPPPITPIISTVSQSTRRASGRPVAPLRGSEGCAGGEGPALPGDGERTAAGKRKSLDRKEQRGGGKVIQSHVSGEKNYPENELLRR